MARTSRALVARLEAMIATSASGGRFRDIDRVRWPRACPSASAAAARLPPRLRAPARLLVRRAARASPASSACSRTATGCCSCATPTARRSWDLPGGTVKRGRAARERRRPRDGRGARRRRSTTGARSDGSTAGCTAAATRLHCFHAELQRPALDARSGRARRPRTGSRATRCRRARAATRCPILATRLAGQSRVSPAPRARRRSSRRASRAYSHSIVPGGLLVMSSTTRPTGRISLIIREAICSSRS